MRQLVLLDGSKGHRIGKDTYTLPCFVYLNGGDFMEMVEWS